MVRRLAAQSVLLGLAMSLCGSAQQSHRRPNPTPPSRPADVFNQLEKQGQEPDKAQSAQEAARKQRSASLAELNTEIPRLVELAQKLQQGLNAADLNQTLPSDLQHQAQELEKAARKISKQVHAL
jgi:hypothetical protein